jgi:hypothetical protein
MKKKNREIKYNEGVSGRRERKFLGWKEDRKRW